MTQQPELTDANDCAQLLIGILDAVFALGVALANAGVLDREEIAEAMERVTAQHEASPEGQHVSRQYAAKALAQLFRVPVVTRFS